MKLRRKDNHRVCVEANEELDRSLPRDLDAYSYCHGDGTSTIYWKNEWEPVVEERWEHAHLEMDKRDNRHLLLMRPKEGWDTIAELPADCRWISDYCGGWIIERRVPNE